MQDRCEDVSSSPSAACSRSGSDNDSSRRPGSTRRQHSSSGSWREEKTEGKTGEKTEGKTGEKAAAARSPDGGRAGRRSFEPDSTLSSLASRVFHDVLSACAFGPTLPDGASSFAGAGDASGSDDSLCPSGRDASLAPSLSVSSIARAERMLQKAVPFVNGGRHIALTTEDMEHIHDGELLRFLEDNSALFVKYFQRPTASHSSPAPEEKEGNAQMPATTLRISAGREEMEEKMEQIETDIATFITAFDSDGHSYRICMDDDGRLLVPVEDDLSNESNVDEEDAGDDSHSHITNDDDNDNCDAEDVAGKDFVHDEKESNAPLLPPRLGRRVRLRPAAPAKPNAHAVVKPTPEPKPGPKPAVKPKTVGRRTFKKRQQAPVRLLGLTEEEDRRVGGLLRGEWNSDPSPYSFSVSAKERLTEIDERLCFLREIRGACEAEHRENENKNDGNSSRECNTTMESATGNDRIHNDTSSHDSAGAKHNAQGTSLQDSVVRPSARSLGNAYLREVRDRRRLEAQIRDINMKLERLHREAELWSLRPSEEVLCSAETPGPRWVSEALPPPPSEEEISALLVAAQAESEAAAARGYTQAYSAPRGDVAINCLRDQMRGALERVAALLPDNDMDECGD